MRRVHFAAAAASLVLAAGLMVACEQAQQAEAPAPDTAAPAANVTVFEGARLIVGDGSAPIENGVLVVDGDTIVAAGAAGAVQAPAGATSVDLTGKTVMPAIVDVHTHLSQTREELILDLRRRAYYGVGAAMSMGTDSGELLPVRDEVIPGAARYLSAGRGITRPEPGRGEVPYWINTVEEARQAVQELAAQEVDLVKIWVDDRNDMYEKLTTELYGAIIDEAHMHGLRVTAHIFELEDAKGLLGAGIDAFAHGVRDMDVDDEFMDLVGQNPDLVLNPNLPGRGEAMDYAWLETSLPTEDFADLQEGNTDNPGQQEAFGIQARNLARMNAAGVTIVLGTDGNTPWAPHEEMENMVAAGMTPADVIVAATGDAAEFLRIADSGTLAAGKSADFIVLDANPLDDITNTRRISAVYLRGAEVDRAAAP